MNMLVTQSCWTLSNCSPPGSSVHGILQARILVGLPFPSPGHLPNPGIEPGSPALQADSLPLYHLGRRIIGTEFLLYDKNGIKPDCGDGCKIL